MNSIGQGLSLILAALALVAILGVAFVYFRGSADKATLESQGRLLASRKDEIDDLTRRVNALEAENRHLQAAVSQVKGIDHLQATVDQMQSAVQEIRGDASAIRLKVGA